MRLRSQLSVPPCTHRFTDPRVRAAVKTWMSSSGFGGYASRAIDGNYNTNWGTGTPAKLCAHSATGDALPYWVEDFGQDVNVTSVTIYIRTDSAGGWSAALPAGSGL